MPTPTERVRRAERSSIRIMFDLAERHDGDLVRLEVGEPDFDTPEHVIDAAAQAAREGATHYTPNAGLPACRRAISETLAENFGVMHNPDEVVVTVGGMEALHLAILATVSPDEEVIVPGPTWPNYETQALLADGSFREVPMPAESGFDLEADRVVEAMSDDTAAVVLTTPSNPTGRVFDRDECRAVVEAAADHDAYVIADEVYLGLTYDGAAEGIAAYTGHPDHVLTVGSCSKAYAMTGWRLGWLAGDSHLIDEVTKIHESTTACASSVAQHAAIAALTGPQEPFEEMYRAFRRRRDLVVDRVGEIDGLSCPRPEGAFYAFLETEIDDDSLSIAKYLLREHGVVLAPGSGFGDTAPERLRLSFANSTERLNEGFDRIEAGLREY
ncbi:aminotransferase class I/II-fold pyridoxal phosphate-dependent enzyme [Natronorubrum sp. JWXQ-INN-674]|uniref:Aminotransferase n=1 Tax=Natronorubrum halalkaliphilum TaxID=2691917 RepID=A0A6B0VI20_9EURY|nr:aminotransferase class I/II-fold pyridoxal phosphate-dependent enzyme [Natronorubrum halalkaliphilum]MXV60596.1 aminotransferase class I/II-fold pyridoxal phosphate-dependent enzyme [Natronorubrum halalkaliphilum]